MRSAPILNEYFQIAESVNSPPVFSNVVTDVIPVSIQTPITLGPRAGFSGYFDVSDPESDPISFVVHSSLDGPINLTHTFSTSALRNITVTARDSHGASSSITLRVDVRNSLPIVKIFAGNTAEATVQFFMNMSGSTGSSFAPSCWSCLTYAVQRLVNKRALSRDVPLLPEVLVELPAVCPDDVPHPSQRPEHRRRKQ